MSLGERKHFLLNQKKLDKDKPTQIYCNNSDAKKLQQQLLELDFKTVEIRTQALDDDSHQLIALPYFRTLVSANWLNKLIYSAGVQPISEAPKDNLVILEVGRDDMTHFIASHVKGARYANTNDFEVEPLWNIVPLKQLKEKIEALGITHNSTVVLYGRLNLSAARLAQILMYAGVQDVRLLDGGWDAWLAQKLPSEAGQSRHVKSVDFGVTIPVYPQYITNIKQLKTMLNDAEKNSVVSVRSWLEYKGEISGYAYIKPKGRIAGAKWGQGGRDANNLDDFKNPDGTMRSADEIKTKWQQWNIREDQKVSFYCGTGWRGSEVFLYAYMMGWKNISLFDGGWFQWSMDSQRPVETGMPVL
ncbi:hypothetical protein PCNPT3_12205 [Psychromonas sp. CNPT3]|nr:hypothetical protein PCNPT3_12205 [Psychromonas sp. CNPT3]